MTPTEERLRLALESAKKTLEVAVKDTPLFIGQIAITKEIFNNERLRS